jgi:FKBP-type peptidyl-prolyl cis-trans isomerase
MKKNSPPSAPVLVTFWRPLAVVSLLTNIPLAVGIWRTHAASTPAASASAFVPASASTIAAVPKSWPSELAPYAGLGSFMAENNRIPDLKWSESQFDAFQEGFRASYEGRGLPLDDNAKRLRDDISKKVQTMLAAEQPNPIEEYFSALREKEGVLRTASGLHYRITEPGEGPTPKPTDSVVISFAGRLPDGRTLPPLTKARVKMVVHVVLPGLAEGVQLLRVGGKALVYLPPTLAFSEKDWPPQLPKGTPLVFFVELHEINPPML